jgi:hypothetical protein
MKTIRSMRRNGIAEGKFSFENLELDIIIVREALAPFTILLLANE